MHLFVASQASSGLIRADKAIKGSLVDNFVWFNSFCNSDFNPDTDP